MMLLTTTKNHIHLHRVSRITENNFPQLMRFCVDAQDKSIVEQHKLANQQEAVSCCAREMQKQV